MVFVLFYIKPKKKKHPNIREKITFIKVSSRFAPNPTHSRH